jgi:hypothetical protein
MPALLFPAILHDDIVNALNKHINNLDGKYRDVQITEHMDAGVRKLKEDAEARVVALKALAISADYSPRFRHNCDACIFIGRLDMAEGRHDLYFCKIRIPTVIARFGDNGPDYMSGLPAGEFPLTVALSIAKKLGLTP